MIGVFDPRSGAAGDMIFGCLLDVLEKPEMVIDEVLGFVDNFGVVDIDFSKKQRNNFFLSSLEVDVADDSSLGFERIKEVLSQSNLDNEVKKDSLNVFNLLNQAEENVHGKRSHFHEVGQLDALVDVVGSVIGFNKLNLDKIYCTSIKVGGGSVETKHGSLGVPTPSTMEILNESDLNWEGGPVNSELLTPTGAALLSYFVDESVRFFPEIVSKKVGRACGSKVIDVPNYLSLVIGKGKKRFSSDEICVLETNVDDIDGEIIGYVKNKLLKEDALDVSIIPLHMKKDRSGYLVKVICDRKNVDDLSETMVEELGTLGVRVIPNIHRFLAEREKITCSFWGYDVDVKVGSFKNGGFFDFSAEFDDCKRIAEAEDISLKEVRDRVEDFARKKYGE